MTLAELLAEYEAVRLVGRSPNTASIYRTEVRRLLPTFGGDLKSYCWEKVLASVATHRIQQGASVATVNKGIRCFRSLLRYAVTAGHISTPVNVTTIRENRTEPRAFLITEIEQILAVCQTLDQKGWRRIATVPASIWWGSLIRATYETGGRIGAMLAVRSRSIDTASQSILLPADHQKQKVAQRIKVSARTLDLMIESHPLDRELIWQITDHINRQRVPSSVFRQFRKICQWAELDLASGTGSLFHRLRKSNASYLEAAGGDATRQLGHSSHAVTARYLDPRIVGKISGVDLIPTIGGSPDSDDPTTLKLPWVS